MLITDSNDYFCLEGIKIAAYAQVSCWGFLNGLVDKICQTIKNSFLYNQYVKNINARKFVKIGWFVKWSYGANLQAIVAMQ